MALKTKKKISSDDVLVKKVKEPIIYHGVKYDSEFEKLFQMWICEAIAYGYIIKAEYHPESYILSQPVFRSCWKQNNKGKWKLSKEEVFGKVVYTLDWRIIWSEKALKSNLIGILKNDRRMSEFGLMAQETKSGNYVSFIDIKPPIKNGGHNASYRDFSIKAPLIYQMNGHYLQSIVPINQKKPEDCFFSRTWTPREYLFRARKDGKGYLISYCKYITIEHYERSKL